MAKVLVRTSSISLALVVKSARADKGRGPGIEPDPTNEINKAQLLVGASVSAKAATHSLLKNLIDPSPSRTEWSSPCDLKQLLYHASHVLVRKRKTRMLRTICQPRCKVIRQSECPAAMWHELASRGVINNRNACRPSSARSSRTGD